MKKIFLIISLLAFYLPTFSQAYLGSTKEEIINKLVNNGCFEILDNSTGYLKIKCNKYDIKNEYFFNSKLHFCERYSGIMTVEYKNKLIQALMGKNYRKIDNNNYVNEGFYIKVENYTDSKTKVRVTGFIDLNTKNNYNQAWTQKMKGEFINSCYTNAKKSLPEHDAKSYCTCMFEKIQLKYTPQTQFNMTNEEAKRLASECLKKLK